MAYYTENIFRNLPKNLATLQQNCFMLPQRKPTMKGYSAIFVQLKKKRSCWRRQCDSAGLADLAERAEHGRLGDLHADAGKDDEDVEPVFFIKK